MKKLNATMNTPNPYIESVVKKLYDNNPYRYRPIGETGDDGLENVRVALTLALEEGKKQKGSSWREGYEQGMKEGKFQGMRENTDKVSEYSFAAGYEDGEAAGRKAAVEYIDNNSWEEIHSGQRYSVTEIETIKAALQASNG